MKPLDLNRILETMIGVWFRADCLVQAQSSSLFSNDTMPSRRDPCERSAEKAAGY
jgi:hypothetical protein